MAKNKHLADEDRLLIERGLKDGVSIKRIAAEPGKSPPTVSREMRARSRMSDKSPPCRIPSR